MLQSNIALAAAVVRRLKPKEAESYVNFRNALPGPISDKLAQAMEGIDEDEDVDMECAE